MEKFFQNIYFPFRIFTSTAIGFLFGILIASIFPVDLASSLPDLLFVTFSLAAALFINCLFKNHFLALISLTFLAATSGVLYFSFFQNVTNRSLPFGEELVIEGRIVKRPEIDWKNQKLTIKVPIADQQNTYLLANLPPFPEYHFGETLRIKGKISEPQNLGDFDYKSYLKRYLIFGIINKPAEVTFIRGNSGLFAKGEEFLFQISQSFEETFNRILPEPHASLAAGILLGVKRNISDSFMSALRTTGLTHIIALSGFNITIIIAIFAQSIAGFVGRRKTFWFGLLFVTLFVMMTGCQPSAIRAAIFSLLLLFGKTVGRQADQTNLMLLAALIMVFLNPYILAFDMGFELSFLAFAGLIYLSGPIAKILEKAKFSIFNFLKRPLAETLGAQMMVVPLLWFRFGTLSLISPLANLLVVWIVPWVMLFTFVSGLLGIIYYPLGKVMALLAWPSLHYIIKATEYLSKMPFAIFTK